MQQIDPSRPRGAARHRAPEQRGGVSRRAALLGAGALAAAAMVPLGAPPARANRAFGSIGGVSFGDSLTGSTGMDWPTSIVGREFGVSWLNAGKHGWASRDIAFLAGVPAVVTVAGNYLPAAGTVGAQVEDTRGISHFANVAIQGRLAGYAVVLSHDAAGRWSVTRINGAGAVRIAPRSRFVSDYAGVQAKAFTIWVGRNNVGQRDGWTHDVLRDVDAIMRLPNVASAPLVVVASVLNRANETSHSRARHHHRALGDIRWLNRKLHERYGRRYVDVRGHLVHRTIHRLGIRPTEADRTAMRGDAPPPSLLESDLMHPTTLAYQDAIYMTVRERLAALGAHRVFA